MNGIRDNVDWVGFVDWTVRDFHGYNTSRGTTYNAYLVRDKKTALIDTVKKDYSARLLSNISSLVDPGLIDYVICNHAEPDHSGSLPAVLRACPNAEVVCNGKCRDALGRHFDTSGWKWKVTTDGDVLPLGERTLAFVDTPMLHWPESMFTFLREEKLLFSMDAFGQHYASARRFDDEEPFDVVMAEAKTYYANIVMPYGKQVAKALDRVAGLGVEVIAPSHGVIWRKHRAAVLSSYEDWMAGKKKPKVLVVYDTMWKSTEQMAAAIVDGAAVDGVEVKLMNVRAGDLTGLASEMLDAAAAAFGSPTLNSTLMPQMAAALTYLVGLKPSGKSGFAFGSYGWAKGGAKDVEDYLKAMKFEILREPLQSQYVPTAGILDECRAAGKMLARKALENH